jgi:hypothetical protein
MMMVMDFELDYDDDDDDDDDASSITYKYILRNQAYCRPLFGVGHLFSSSQYVLIYIDQL